MSQTNHEEYVVRQSEQSDVFLAYYDEDPQRCQWGALESAMTFTTLAEAQSLAAAIGGGTVGTPRPKS
jgi:hypothetical protein